MNIIDISPIKLDILFHIKSLFFVFIALKVFEVLILAARKESRSLEQEENKLILSPPKQKVNPKVVPRTPEALPIDLYVQDHKNSDDDET